MKDEATNLSKEAFEAAKPKLDTGLVYAPYRMICSEVIVTGTGGEIRTRQKAYSRLIHGRIEDDIRQVLKKHIGKKLDKDILNNIIGPIRWDMAELFFNGLNSEFLNLTTFPIILNIEGSEWKIERDGRIECVLKPAVQYIDLNFTITKNEE